MQGKNCLFLQKNALKSIFFENFQLFSEKKHQSCGILFLQMLFSKAKMYYNVKCRGVRFSFFAFVCAAADQTEMRPLGLDRILLKGSVRYMNKIKITVAGTQYSIMSQEEPEYVEGLARNLDKQLRTLLGTNPSLSLSDALILCSLQYMDDAKKNEDTADHLRAQFSGYMDEIKEAKDREEALKKDLEQMRRETLQLKVEMQHLKNSK